MLPSQRFAHQGSRWKVVGANIDKVPHFRSESRESREGRESRESGVPLSRSPSVSGNPKYGKDIDDTRAKLAGDSFHPDELYELNGPDFWRDWERAGGDPDEYFKETLPNYGLVGSLFMTISIPATLDPPSFGFNGKGEADKNEFYVSIFVVMMCITTVISLISVLLAICIHQQYINAYSRALRVDFAARYGYLVGVLTSLLVIVSRHHYSTHLHAFVCMYSVVCLGFLFCREDALALFFGMACAMCTMFRLDASLVGLCVMFVGGMWAVAFYVSITTWNANHYSKQMAIDIKRMQQEERDDDSAPFTPSPGGVRRVSSKLSMFDIARIQHQAHRRQMQLNAVHPIPSTAEGAADVGAYTCSDSARDPHDTLLGRGQVGESRGTLETLQHENDHVMAMLHSSSFHDKSPVQYDGHSHSAVGSE